VGKAPVSTAVHTCTTTDCRRKRIKTAKTTQSTPDPEYDGGLHEVDRLREQAHKRLRMMRCTLLKKLHPMSVSSPTEFLKWFAHIPGATSTFKYTQAGYLYERVVLTSYADIAQLLRLEEAGLQGVGASVIRTGATLTGSFVVPPLILTCRSRERLRGGAGLSSCLVRRSTLLLALACSISTLDHLSPSLAGFCSNEHNHRAAGHCFVHGARP
jgi:hypothetical protein